MKIFLTTSFLLVLGIACEAGFVQDANRKGGMDKAESALLPQFPGIRRNGPTLTIRTPMKIVELKDSTAEGESALKHHLIGSMKVSPSRTDLVVFVSGWESKSFLLVNGATGAIVTLPDDPEVSPDKKHVVAGHLDLEVGYAPNTLDIIRLSDYASVFHFTWPENERSGPANIRWDSPKVILFDKMTLTGSGKATRLSMRLEQSGGKWAGPHEVK